MKKIISFFAASALALGLIGCSGDLHENDILPLAIVGMTADAGNHVIPMTLDKPDGSEQSLKITLKDGFKLTGANGIEYQIKDDPTGSWRQGTPDPITSLHFKVIPGVNVKADGSPDWTMDFASLNKEDPQYITAGEDYQKVGKRGDANVSGDPKHLIFDGCIAGETYVLRAKYNAAAGTLSLKLDGEKNDPAGVKFVFAATDYETFPAKDKDNKDLSYSMSKAGSTYTYQFIAKADETLSFYLTNAMAGTLGGTLSTTASDLAVNEATPTNMSLAVKKNVEYKITVDVSKGIAKATIKYEVVDMLKDAKINANWIYADNSYEVEYKSPFYFQAENTDLSFTVNRISGDDTLAWGTASAIDVDGEAVELTYTEEGKAKPVVVKGLKKGDWYLVKLAENNETFTLTAKVISAPIPDISTFNSYMWSNVNNSGWGQDTTKYPYPKGFPKFVKDSTQENTFYCDFSPVDTSVEFGIKKFNDEVETDGISNWYGCGAEIKGLNTEVSGDITKGNSKIIGLEAGKNYRLYVTFLNPVIVSMKVIGK